MSYYIDNIKQFVEKSAFKEISGFEIQEISEGEVHARIDLVPVFMRYDGIAHGGFISYFADSIMGFAALTLVGEEKTVFTAEMKISYLNPGLGDHLIGKAYVLKSGRNIHFCEAEIYGTNSSGIQYLASKASATMAVSDKRNDV